MRTFAKTLLGTLLFFSISTIAIAEQITIVTEHWPPFQFAEGEEVTRGVGTEIVQEILKETKLKTKILAYPWARAYSMALKQENVLIFSLTRSKQRETLFKWVGPIYQLEGYLWALNDRSDISIHSMEDAKQYIVGAPRNDHQHQYLKKNGFVFDENLYLVKAWPQAMKMLYANRVDLIMGPPLPLAYNLKTLGLDYSKLKQVLKLDKPPAVLYIAFSKATSDSLVIKFQKAYQKIKNNGSYDTILQNWININK